MSTKKDGLGWFAKTLIGVAVLGGGTYVGVRIWAAVPPSPLTPSEQSDLRSAGVVWAAPDAPTPAGVEHMVLLSKVAVERMQAGYEPNCINPVGLAEANLGLFRLIKLVGEGYRFWRPKTPEDTAKESSETHKAGA